MKVKTVQFVGLMKGDGNIFSIHRPTINTVSDSLVAPFETVWEDGLVTRGYLVVSLSSLKGDVDVIKNVDIEKVDAYLRGKLESITEKERGSSGGPVPVEEILKWKKEAA